jgi:hypothetical protein
MWVGTRTQTDAKYCPRMESQPQKLELAQVSSSVDLMPIIVFMVVTPAVDSSRPPLRREDSIDT